MEALSEDHLHPRTAEASSTPNYKGGALQDGEIRLIMLLPGVWTDPVRCNLFSVSLANAPRYKTLSYVWGPRRITRPIALNGYRFQATVNLESALRHIRHVHGSLVLWVDALCINQSDNQERTHQVQLMGRIYKSCQEVLVYLGDNAARTEHKDHPLQEPVVHTFYDDQRDDNYVAKFYEEVSRWKMHPPDESVGNYAYDQLAIFSFIRTLKPCFESPNEDAFFRADGLFESCVQSSRSRSSAVNVTEENQESGLGAREAFGRERLHLFEALRRLMHPPWTPWWSRIWVVQEVVFPPSVTIMHGAISAPWRMFSQAALLVDKHIQSCCEELTRGCIRDEIKVLTDFSRRVDYIEQLRASYSEARKDVTMKSAMPLLPLLRQLRDRNASDPRDKVYALLSLVGNEDGNHQRIVPDYSVTVAETFRQATLQCIATSRSLSVLATDLSRKFTPGLPSWVPDWDAPGGYGSSGRADAIQLYTACSKWSATEETFRAYDLGTLLVSGAYIGTIAKVGDVMWGDTTEATADVLSQWSQLLERGLYYEESFWKLICAEVLHATHNNHQGKSVRRLTDADTDTFLAWVMHSKRSPVDISDRLHREVSRAQRNHTEIIFTDVSWPFPLSGLIPDSCGRQRGVFEGGSRHLAAAKMDASILAATSSRRLILVTSRWYLREYAGLAPADAQRGDIVVFLKGGKIPFLIRPQSGTPIQDLFGLPIYPRGPIELGNPIVLNYQSFSGTVYTLVGDCYVEGLMDFEEEEEEEDGSQRNAKNLQWHRIKLI